MRWFVEISALGKNPPPSTTLCVEAAQWQPALQKARALRGDGDSMSSFSIELLDDGYRAIDPTTRVRYVIRKAPDDTALSSNGAANPAEPPARADEGGPGSGRGRPSTPPAPSPSRAPASRPTADAPSWRIVSDRSRSPTATWPLTYREIAYAVPENTTEELAAALILQRFERVRDELSGGPGRMIHLAVVDHELTGTPCRPPLATLLWKDWNGSAPELRFPRQEALGDVPTALVQRRSSTPSSDAASVSASSEGSARRVHIAATNPTPSSEHAGRSTPPAAAYSAAAVAAALPVVAVEGPPSPAPAFAPSAAAAAEGAPLSSSSVPTLQALPRVASHPNSSAAVASHPNSSAAVASHPNSSAAVASHSNSSAAVASERVGAAPVIAPAGSAPRVSDPAAPSRAHSTLSLHDTTPSAHPIPGFSATPTPSVQVVEEISVPVPVDITDTPARATPEPPGRTAPADPPARGSSPGSRRPSRPPRRLSGDELLAEVFEAFHELSFVGDSLAGADLVLEVIREKLPTEITLLSFFDINKRQFVVVRQEGGTGSVVLARFSERSLIPQSAMRSRRAVVVADAAADARVAADPRFEAIGVAVKSFVCAPVEVGGRYLGLIELVNPKDGGRFTDGDGHAMTYVGQQLAELVAQHGVIVDADTIMASAQRVQRR